jgi:two-component system, NtrC family, sensor histidine kinase PilS
MRYLALARLIVAALLVAYLPLMRAGVGAPDEIDAPLFLSLAVLYLFGAVAFALLPNFRRWRFDLLVAAQVLIDFGVLTLLMHAAGGVRSGFGLLLFLPTAGAAIVSSARLGLFFAAAAALLVLAESVWRSLRGFGGDDFLQAGLLGAALFATVLLVNRLARRLATQERLAVRRADDLRNQLAITQVVISELQDGLVVLGADGEVRAINAAARAMLGAAGETPAPNDPPAGFDALREALREVPEARDGVAFSVPVAGSGEPRRLRARRLGGQLPRATDTAVMIEDLDRLEQRVQQLKLASMGRLSASIAHEIRNPLGAIRHANSLLAERLDEPGLQRLAAIVEANSVRIDRVIEDVLAIARRSPASPEALPARVWLRALLAEYVAQAGADEGRIRCEVATDAPIWFDGSQLRQVLVNLLDNALRHASAGTGAVAVEWREASRGRAVLRIADDGPGIPATAREHLFEPFYTTEARGTGLGLYVARELCNANGAGIRYDPTGDNRGHRGAFVIEPRQPERR